MSVDDLRQDAVQRTLDAVRPALESAFADFAQALQRELTDVHTRAREAAVAEVRQKAEAELAAASADADRQLADLQEELTARITEFERKLVDVRAQAEDEARNTQFEVEKEHRDELAAAVEQARAAAADGAVSEARRLLESISTLDDASALGDALTRLTECARREAERAAVLVMKEQRLQGWAFLGFDESAATPTGVSVDPRTGGLLGRAVDTAAPVASDQVATPLALPPFAGKADGRHAVALPVLVGGTVVAVLYADAAQQPGGMTWPSVLEVLTRHASRMLEAMMVAQASGVRIPRAAGQ